MGRPSASCPTIFVVFRISGSLKSPCLSAAVGRVLTKPVLTVLCGKSVLDDRHFLHRRVGYRAFLRPLMTFGITEGGAIKPVFRGHGLAAVDSGSKLAAAEDRVAVRLHGHKAGLQLQ